jgi:hypothetical protein
MSDIMDEFEFKPLTDGLGFHSKNQSRIAQTVPADIPKETKSSFEGGGFSTPLPRPQREKAPLSTDLPSTTVDEILKTLNQKKRPDFVNSKIKTKIDATPELPRFKTSSWDFSSFLLDLMLILAMNLLCLIVLLLTTKIDLFANLYKPDAEHMIYWSLLGLFVCTTWIYLVVNRMFMGSTPGEWVFDQRLGHPQDTGSAMYSMLVMARATLVIASGIILFPIISAVMNRDILGRIMGLEIMKKV